MALTSTLGSPGIEIREVDNSYRLDSSTATTVYIPGFTSQGPVDEVISIGSISDFETIYGIPTNAAERYFYYTVKAVLDNSGSGVTVLCSRLPYGSGKGDTVTNAYTLLAYPAIPVIKTKHNPEKPIVDANGYYSFVVGDKNNSIVTTKDYSKLVGKTLTITGSKSASITSLNVTLDGKELSFKNYSVIGYKYDEGDASKDTTEEPFTTDDSSETKYEIVFGGDTPDSDKVIIHVITTKTGSIDQSKVLDETINTTATLSYESLVKPEGSEFVDFDQFVTTPESTVTFENLFDLSTTKQGTGTISAKIKECYVTLDDKEAVSALLLTSFDASSASDVPTITKLIDFKDSTADAPTLKFNSGTYEARGTVGTETVVGTNNSSVSYVYLSYTIFKGSEKVGSIFVKVSYNEDVQGKFFVTNTSTNIGFAAKTAYEIAASYEGQSEKDYVDGNTDNLATDVTYVLGSPATFQISLNDYYKIITGENLKWSRKPYDFTGDAGVEVGERYKNDESKTPAQFGLLDAIGHSAFIVINTSRSIVNNNFEGFYLGLTDNMFVTPSADYTYDAIDSVKITTKYFDKTQDTIGLLDAADDSGDFHTLNENRLSFYLNSNYQGSVSRVLTRNITSMDISGTEFDDTISMGLFKLSKSTTSSDILKLNYSLREKYNWSFGKTRLKSLATATRPVSYFAENIVEDSSNLTILVNPFISEKSFVDTDGVVHGKIRVYGNKLVKNLNGYENKYLRRSYINLNSNTEESTKKQSVSAIIPAKLAKSSINTWGALVSQAGVSTSLLNSIPEKITTVDEVEVPTYKTFTPLNSLIPFGTYTSSSNTTKVIGSVPAKLERALELVENDEEYPDIDIVLEGGLGTIYSYSTGKGSGGESGENAQTMFIDENDGGNISDEEGDELSFDENKIVEGIEDLRTGRTSLSDAAQEFIENYRAVQTVFTNFANSMQNGGRGDCFYISDVPRGVLIKGKNTKVTDLFGSTIENNAYDFGNTVNHSFSTSIYYPIKHTFDTVVSSYMSTYAQWVKILDNHSSEKVWIPVSGYIAGNMAATDGTYGPWYAAAGLRRGVISGVLDYALSPSVTQRTDLYKICINSVPKIPNYGVTIWGIRTMSKAASAFDQNTCRRTFLYMEKKVKQTLRYYIFEPNTSYTRLQIVNDLDPFLEKVKNAGGIYSYTLVCDNTNNTPDVINNGDLAVSIAAAPTRTAENIVVEFTANKYTEEVSAAESIQ